MLELITDMLREIEAIKKDPRDFEFPNKKEYNWKLPDADYVLKALQLILKLPKRLQHSVDITCMQNGGYTLTWNTQGDWRIMPQEEKATVYVSFMKNYTYHKFLWFNWKTGGEEIISVGALGKYGDIFQRAKDVDEAVELILPILKHKEFSSR